MTNLGLELRNSFPGSRFPGPEISDHFQFPNSLTCAQITSRDVALLPPHVVNPDSVRNHKTKYGIFRNIGSIGFMRHLGPCLMTKVTSQALYKDNIEIKDKKKKINESSDDF